MEGLEGDGTVTAWCDDGRWRGREGENDGGFLDS